MALTDDQRGPRAVWLRSHRIARFGSGQGGLAALGAELRARGAYRAPDTIKGWEASDERSPIPADVVPHLVEIFEDPYPAPMRQASQADLIAELAKQTAAISALVEELRLTRLEQAEWNRGVVDVLQALGVRAFGAPKDGPASEPPAVAPHRGRSE